MLKSFALKHFTYLFPGICLGRLSNLACLSKTNTGKTVQMLKCLGLDRQRQEDPWDCWPASLAKRWVSGYIRDPVSKLRWKATEEDTVCQLTTSTCIHIYRRTSVYAPTDIDIHKHRWAVRRCMKALTRELEWRGPLELKGRKHGTTATRAGGMAPQPLHLSGKYEFCQVWKLRAQ